MRQCTSRMLEPVSRQWHRCHVCVPCRSYHKRYISIIIKLGADLLGLGKWAWMSSLEGTHNNALAK